MGVVDLAENIATQPSLAGAWAELGNYYNSEGCTYDSIDIAEHIYDE